MKLRLVLVSLAVALITVSVAVAAPPPGKGKPSATGEGCKPKVTVVLKGTLASAPLNVTVTKANRWGRAYVSTSAVTVTLNAETKVRRQGKKSLGDLVVGDRVLVQARVCKADLADDKTPPLTAVRVVAHPTKA